ncbi:hypothetical protein ONV78_13325 [Hahella sp. CR1]|uniref:hypothetical protein n=1 Tax=Hahella sp. CR1 TaxID=2992807 RepID=UPI002442330A|nr:hypothetical protein [Hahella sp. CR1]MDG9668718.1 hypothetical protein [Hahella sp. CR1]
MDYELIIKDIIFVTCNRYDQCMKLMVSCLDIVEDYCPKIGIAGINSATRFWSEGIADADDLLQVRVESWKYLDDRSASTNTAVREFCALRAVICVLYASPPSEDNAEIVECFLGFLNIVEPNHEVLSEKLRQKVALLC